MYSIVLFFLCISIYHCNVINYFGNQNVSVMFY
jgi:hypothetical protein